MHDDQGDKNDKGFEELTESEAVERRSTPRAPLPGLVVEGLEGDPLVGKYFSAREFGTESLFLEGEVASSCKVGHEYRMRLCYGDQAVDCMMRCVRIEEVPRQGGVFKLLTEERKARELMVKVLRPSSVPVGAD